MTSPFDPHPTTRRRFVLDVVGGLTTTASLSACGATTQTRDRAGPEVASGTGGGAEPESDGGGGIATGGAGGSSGGAAGGNATGGTGPSATGGAPPAEAGTCALYPQETEGPFYLDLG